MTEKFKAPEPCEGEHYGAYLLRLIRAVEDHVNQVTGVAAVILSALEDRR